MTDTTRGNLWLLLFAVSFACSTLVFRAAGLVDLRPLVLLTGGLLAGSILCFPFFLRRVLRESFPIKPQNLIDMGILVLVEATLPYWLQIEGLRHTTATKAGIILCLIPVMTLIFSRLILARVPTRGMFLRVAGLLIGGFLISWEGQLGMINLGDWLILGAAACLGLASVIVHRLMKDWPLEVILQTRLTTGFLILLPITLHFEPTQAWYHDRLVLYALATGLFLTVFTISIYKGIQWMGPEYAVLYDIVAAVFIASGAYFLWGEWLNPVQWIGAVIILGLTVQLFISDTSVAIDLDDETRA